METLVGSGVIDPMEDMSHMEDFLVEEFSSEQGSAILKANSVIDPSSWTLLRACLDMVVLGSCTVPNNSLGTFKILLDLLQVRASDTKDKSTLEVSISADQPFDSDSGKSGQSESLNSYQPSVKESQQKHIDSDESRSIKSVKDEFDRLGMKMPKGIIFKEEKIEKETDQFKVPKTSDKANGRQQQEKMPLTRRSSDISYFLRGMRKKYKKKIKVPRNYSCEKCEFQSPDPQKYYKHVLYIHTGRQIQCDKCDKKYFSMSHLKEHIEGTHEAVMQICETCNFKTNKKRHLERHILDNHREGTILCSECPFKTSTNSKLKIHMERSHTPREKWPKCPWPDCDYTWCHQQNVDNHYRKVHEGVRVSCEICPNTFTDKSNMQAHMMKIHSDLVVRKENARTSGSFEERYTVLKP